ncbi:nitrogenase [filamentous cyanobacterium CCP2]|nr:nitrogenase [filamentous cyanobacterium CCP2]
MSTLTHQNNLNSRGHPTLDILAPLRQWIDRIEIHSDRLAHFICRLIPCTCPFEQDISLFGKTLHIPPLCKLNPLYSEFVSLRFRALSYLSDIRGEDVTKYIC